jgi:hypothetical protein
MQRNSPDDWDTFQFLRPDRENIDWDLFWHEVLVELPLFFLAFGIAFNVFRIVFGLQVMNWKTAAQLTGVIPDKETDELMAALEKQAKEELKEEMRTQNAQKARSKSKQRYEVVSKYNEEHKIEDDFGFDD